MGLSLRLAYLILLFGFLSLVSPGKTWSSIEIQSAHAITDENEDDDDDDDSCDGDSDCDGVSDAEEKRQADDKKAGEDMMAAARNGDFAGMQEAMNGSTCMEVCQGQVEEAVQAYLDFQQSANDLQNALNNAGGLATEAQRIGAVERIVNNAFMSNNSSELADAIANFWAPEYSGVFNDEQIAEAFTMITDPNDASRALTAFANNASGRLEAVANNIGLIVDLASVGLSMMGPDQSGFNYQMIGTADAVIQAAQQFGANPGQIFTVNAVTDATRVATQVGMSTFVPNLAQYGPLVVRGVPFVGGVTAGIITNAATQTEHYIDLNGSVIGGDLTISVVSAVGGFATGTFVTGLVGPFTGGLGGVVAGAAAGTAATTGIEVGLTNWATDNAIRNTPQYQELVNAAMASSPATQIPEYVENPNDQFSLLRYTMENQATAQAAYEYQEEAERQALEAVREQLIADQAAANLASATENLGSTMYGNVANNVVQ